MKITTLRIDLERDVFHMHGEDANDKVVITKRMSRNKLPAFIDDLPSCLIGIEACGGALLICMRD